MSSKSDIEYLTFVLEKIIDLENYILKYNKISLLLEDKMGHDASFMCLLQIGETLNKLHHQYDLLDKEDIKGSYDVRNFIAHDYMGVDLGFVEAIIRDRLPALKKSIEIILEIIK